MTDDDGFEVLEKIRDAHGVVVMSPEGLFVIRTQRHVVPEELPQELFSESARSGFVNWLDGYLRKVQMRAERN